MPSYFDVVHCYAESLVMFEKLMDAYDDGEDISDALEELWHHMYDDVMYHCGGGYYEKCKEEDE